MLGVLMLMLMYCYLGLIKFNEMVLIFLLSMLMSVNAICLMLIFAEMKMFLSESATCH